MARTKITASIAPGIAETLKRVAAIDDGRISNVLKASSAGSRVRGRDRLNNMLSMMIARLAGGRSTLQETYNLPEHERTNSASHQEAAP